MMLADKIYELRQLLLSQSSLVMKMLSLATEGLFDAGFCFLDDVMTFEKRVNQIEIEIEKKCISLIALQQPAAKDLRQILMIYKINNAIERLGDQAVNIAESSSALSGRSGVEQVPERTEMKLATTKMLRDSLQAFNQEDSALAQAVCNDDNIVDNYNRQIISHLIMLMQKAPEKIQDYLHLMRISRNYERIADLSTNIAENTIYLAQGRVIKHNIDERLS